jgi:hypothetical protein
MVPPGEKFDRKTLERIIRRAAELQANQQEVGDDLTEEQVMELGKEVGLPSRYIQQAILEERTQAHQSGEKSLLVRWIGPRTLTAQRTVPGDEEDIEQALAFWMESEELLTVKRRYQTATSWEPKKGFFAAIRRMGGKNYALSRAREVLGEVTQLEPGWSHVRLTADLSTTWRESLWGAIAFAGAGGAMAVIFGVAGFAIPAIIAPPAGGLAALYGIGSTRRQAMDRVTVALEQILDRLEHREINPGKVDRTPGGEIGRALTQVRRHLRNLGPGQF